MGSTDRLLRNPAQPFFGHIFGYNSNEQSEQDISNALLLGDLNNLANNSGGGYTPGQDNMVRILRPKSGHILEAHFTMALRFASAETNPYFKISVHKVTSSTDLTRLTPSEAEINASMLKLTGSTTPYSGTAGQITAMDALNILPLIPQTDSADYVEDCFTMGVHFYQSNGVNRATPSNGSGYKLYKFRIELSASVY